MPNNSSSLNLSSHGKRISTDTAVVPGVTRFLSAATDTSGDALAMEPARAQPALPQESCPNPPSRDVCRQQLGSFFQEEKERQGGCPSPWPNKQGRRGMVLPSYLLIPLHPHHLVSADPAPQFLPILTLRPSSVVHSSWVLELIGCHVSHCPLRWFLLKCCLESHLPLNLASWLLFFFPLFTYENFFCVKFCLGSTICPQPFTSG